jgi:hypothetical protein
MANAIVFPHGDDFSEALTIRADDGSAYDLTDGTLWFTLKVRLDDADADAALQHESGDGLLTITNAAGGLATHRVTAAESAALTAGQVYHYDYQIRASDGTLATLERGKLVLTGAVTEATS